jgi:hypothetical protein
MWLAELKDSPKGLPAYVVSPDDGDELQFTLSKSIACKWLTESQVENWIRHHGGKWSPVKR